MFSRRVVVGIGILVPLAVALSLAVSLLARNSELYKDLFGSAGAPITAIAGGEAREAGLDKLAALHPEIADWVVERLEHSSKVELVSDNEGLLKAVFEPGVDAWVMELHAPGPAGYSHASSIVVVDAVTGEVLAADVMAYNDK